MLTLLCGLSPALSLQLSCSRWGAPSKRLLTALLQWTAGPRPAHRLIFFLESAPRLVLVTIGFSLLTLCCSNHTIERFLGGNRLATNWLQGIHTNYLICPYDAMDCLSKLGKVELGYKPRLSASTDLNLRKAFMYIKRRFLQLLQGGRGAWSKAVCRNCKIQHFLTSGYLSYYSSKWNLLLCSDP